MTNKSLNDNYRKEESMTQKSEISASGVSVESTDVFA
jgi:hypothetical protein